MDIALPKDVVQTMMLGWFACSTLLVAGFSLSAGVSYLFDWSYQKRDEDSLAFSFICLALAGHSIVLVFLYRAVSTSSYVLALKFDLCFLFVAQAAFVWFVTSHMHVGPRWVTYLFAAYFALLLVANVASANSLMASEVRNLLVQAFPGGEPYVSAVFVPSIWNPLCLAGTFATSAYCLFITYRGRHNVGKGEALVLAVSLVCLFTTWLRAGYLGPTAPWVLIESHAAFLAFILLMESAMSSRYGQQASSLAQTHDALRESEERFRILIEKAPDAIIVYDPDRERFVDANPSAAILFGCSRNELLASELQRFRSPTASDDVSESVDIRALSARALAGEEVTFEQPFRNARGRELICDVRLVRLPFAEQRLIRASLIDITERKKAERDGLEYQQRLRSLASELALTEERERKRIAIYLHDQVAQELVAVRLMLGKIAADTDAARVADQINEVRGIISHTVKDTYSLTFELSLPVLYELGLIPAVEWLGEKICEANGVHFKLIDDGLPKPLDNDLRIACFYVVRELFHNVNRHARASNVMVAAHREDERLWLVVQDDGVGFDVAAPRDLSRSEGGYGMFGVRDRLEYLGGTMSVESELGRGTRVTLSAPLGQGLPVKGAE